MRKLVLCFVCLVALTLAWPDVSAAQSKTLVPAKGRSIDADGNGYPDAGVLVVGHYTALLAYDQAGDWYWDLGDGRIYGTVADPSLLDAATLTTCDYVNNFRGTFNNSPFMDSGWIQNHVRCTGLDRGAFNYVIVHKTDPRYTGNPERSVWGDWEYHVLTEWGAGNLVRRLPGL